MTDYDMTIHKNPDAVAWAKFFCETNPNCGLDESVMVGWFANAMMAMHDYIKGVGPLCGDEAQYWADRSNQNDPTGLKL